MSQLDVIIEKIEYFSSQLQNLICKNSTLTDNEVVKASQNLDKQLNSYYRAMKKLKKSA